MEFNINIKKNRFYLFYLLFFTQIILILLFFNNNIKMNNIRIISTIFIILINIIILYFLILKKIKVHDYIIFQIFMILYIYFLQSLFLDNLFRIFIWLNFILFLIFNFNELKKYLNEIFNFNKITLIKLFMLFLVIWLFYNIITVFWAKNLKRVVIREEFILYANIIFLFLYFLFNKDKDYIYKIDKLFIIVFIITIFIGLFEIYKGMHLPCTRAYRYKNTNRFIPGSVYWNENDFATFIFIFLIFPFIALNKIFYNFKNFIIGIFIKKKFHFDIKKFFYLIYYILLFFILFFSIYYSLVELIKTQSRANILSYYLFFIIFLILISLTLILLLKNKILRIGLLIGLFLFLLIFTIYFSDNKNFIYKKLPVISKINKIILSIKSGSRLKNNSIYVRINLIKNGLLMLKNSGFLGVGGGNIEILMKDYSKEYFDTQGFTNIHNFWIELLVDYGIVVFLLFIVFYFYLIIFSLKILFQYILLKREYIYNNPNIIKLLFIISSIIAFSIASVSTSSLLTRPIIWIYFSYIVLSLEKMSYDYEMIIKKMN